MKELLHRIKEMENEIDGIEQKIDYWMSEDHFNETKVEQYEQQSDEVYERLYRVFDQAASMIVSITAGQVDKITAMSMIRSRRSDVERIFA